MEQLGIYSIMLTIMFLVVGGNSSEPKHNKILFNRSTYPSDFIFGAGSAAYQSEGGAYIDGKGPSIWDVFTKEHPEKIWDRSTGEVAYDFYHKYKEDVQLMKKVGLDSFRFSISWPRILPKGRISGGINAHGVKFYNNLIDEIIANGMKPFVTLFHWDLPQALEEEYKGFLSSKIVDDFKEYVDFCFKIFGDRVKDWCTLNEPYSYSIYGYNGGTFAPGRCSKYMGNCTLGNSGTEPYIVAHNLLLSHATAVRLYKQKYQVSQKGIIGITLVTHWFVPMSPASDEDQKAAERELDFFFGWYANPITYGDYPEVMKTTVRDRLPRFTKEESKMLKGSLDFMGINYYTTYYVKNNPLLSSNHSWTSDAQTTATPLRNGVSIGPATDLSWLYVYPKGIYHLMLHVRDKYKNPPIFITENGLATSNNASMSIKESLKDGLRIRYMHDHLTFLLKAIKEGANVKGYYAWNFMDDFEWDAGFTVRFGIIYVDFKDKLLKRFMKSSAYWYKKFLLH